MKKIITILLSTLFISLTAFASNSSASEIAAANYSQKKEVILAKNFMNASESQVINNASLYKKTDFEFN